MLDVFNGTLHNRPGCLDLEALYAKKLLIFQGKQRKHVHKSKMRTYLLLAAGEMHL